MPDKVLRKVLTLLKMKNCWDKTMMVPYFGSQWIGISQDCATYIADFHRLNPKYYQLNRHTFAPDEHFFHTIIGNSPFASQCDEKISFVERGTWRLANFHIIDPSLTKWYTIHDWAEIENSDKLFLRKVRSSDGNALLDKIDKKISTN